MRNHSSFLFFLLFTETSLIMIIVMLGMKLNAYFEVPQSTHWVYFLAL